MAKKETKAEATVRENLEYEAQYAAFVETYAARFAAAMFDYMTLTWTGFSVSRLDAETYVFSSQESYSTVELKVTPPANRNWEAVAKLEQVEDYLKEYALEQEEENRKYYAKQAALNKLSKEERELLGL